MITLLRKELHLARIRVQNIRAFIAHKIKKGKARYTNLVHRIEDWMVDTIKYESDSMYSYAKRTKASILSVNPIFLKIDLIY